MNDDHLTGRWQEAVREYNLPPETPRDELWARIDAARRRDYGVAGRRPAARRWLTWGTGIAAVLALGITLGRVSVRPDAAPDGVAIEPAPPEDADAALPYRVAAAEHLSRTEIFLTTFRSTADAGPPGPQVGEWGRDLLASTRLLLDSPAADDPRVLQLLGDLEVILVQIVQLASGGAEDLDLIRQAIEYRDVLPRLRTAVPAGPMPAGT